MFCVLFCGGRFAATSDIACAAGLFEERRLRSADLFWREDSAKKIFAMPFSTREFRLCWGVMERECSEREELEASAQCGRLGADGDKSGRCGKRPSAGT